MNLTAGPGSRVSRAASAGLAARSLGSVVRRHGRLAVLSFPTAGGVGGTTSELLGDGPGGEESELVGGLAAFLDAVGADGQAGFARQLEHVEGDVHLADLGVA